MPDSDSVLRAKAELRTRSLARRADLTEDERYEAGADIASHAIDAWLFATTIAAYVAVGSEPATMPFIAALSAAGVRVLLPVIDADSLDWALFDDAESMAPGPLGIREPTGPRLGADALLSAEVVVVPALAVDPAGHRLGRGRGFYDRALASVTAPVVAVVYDAELIDAVPVEPHDRRVDAILRPAGLTPSNVPLHGEIGG